MRLQERRLVGGEATLLAELRAGDESAAALLDGRGSPPLHRHALGDEPLDGLGEIAHPGVPA
jgi:hypothetical protein